jgi:hypothetical protein
MPTPENVYTSALQKLAQRLAKNHLNLSVLNGTRESEYVRMARIALHDTTCQKLRSRTIVVVGAGASLDAFGGDEYPDAHTALQRIDSELCKKHHIAGKARKTVRTWISSKKARIEALYGFTQTEVDFETHLGALSSVFGDEEVRRELRATYGRPNAPHLTFEILAHLLKHRFVDAIINFNFDELLDIAVRHEMGGSDYLHAVSDGDCQPLDAITIEGRLKIPLYIKPHGTVSHPSTLRFTKEHYYELPPAMKTFLTGVVQGLRGDASTGRNERTHDITLITIGFGMNSLDLNRILDGVDEEKVVHFAIDTKPPRTNARFKEQHWLQVSPTQRRVGEVMRKLWSETSSQFRTTLQPRGIKRHLIVHRLFHSAGTGPEPGHRVPRDDQEYAYARLCTEIAIELARGNGQINTEAMTVGRVGYYLKHLSDLVRKNGAVSRRFAAPLASVYKAFGVVPRRYTGRVLTCPLPDKKRFVEATDVNKEIARSLWTNLRRVLSETSHDLRDHIASDSLMDGEMKDALEALCASDALTIEPRFDAANLIVSTGSKAHDVLHTNLAVSLEFLEMIGRRDFDLLLIVSTFGKVLDWYRSHHSEFLGTARMTGVQIPAIEDRFFSVVTSEAPNHQAIRKRLNGFRSQLLGPHVETRDKATDPFYFRPGWASRRNFIVALTRHRTELRPTSAIEFMGSRHRANPVFTDRKADLDRLIDSFFGYVAEAESYMGHAPRLTTRARSDRMRVPPLTSHLPTVTVEQARSRRESLLKSWAARMPVRSRG